MDESNLTLDKSPQREITIKKQIKYLLYEPKEYTDKKACPLLIFLHGAGERGDDLELVKKHGPPKLIESGVDFPFFVASPQLPPDEWWSPSTVLWVLRDVQSRVNVDADRVYLTGLSMGGYGTWETAARYPHLFAAIAPICGRGDPCTADKDLSWCKRPNCTNKILGGDV
jgi:predicted peptidase